MGRRVDPRTLLGTPEVLAALYLKNLGKRRHTQAFEGVVTEKVDATHLKVRTAEFGAPVTLLVKYSTCDAEAFEVGDFVLCFAPNCKLEKTQVRGFTRKTRPCMNITAQVYAVESITPAQIGTGDFRNRFLLRKADMTAKNWANIGFDVASGAVQLIGTREIEAPGADFNGAAYVDRVALRLRGDPVNVTVYACPVGCQTGAHGKIGVNHGNHVHVLWASTGGTFPFAAFTLTPGDLGAALDDFFAGYHTTTPNRTSVAGWNWTGFQFALRPPAIRAVVEGRDVGSGNTGVLVAAPLLGTVTPIWMPMSETFDTKTATVSYPCHSSNVGSAACTVEGLLPAGSATFICLPSPPDPPPPGCGTDSYNETYTPFTRWYHSSRITEEYLAGVPSPVVPIYGQASEAYVLIPVVYHDFQHDYDTTPTTFVAGVDPCSALPAQAWRAFQGERAVRQRLYRVREDTAAVTTWDDTDIALWKYNTGTRRNELQAAPIIKITESRSKWRKAIYHDAPALLAHWWNPFYRVSGYTSLTGAAGAPETTTSIPFVAPGGDKIVNPFVVEPSPIPVHAGGNWQLLDADLYGSVAGWYFRWQPDDLMPPNSYNSEEYTVAPTWADHPHDSLKFAKGHGDGFEIYYTKDLLTNTILRGACGAPGNYLTYPCLTPDGKKCVFVAHGVFQIPGTVNLNRFFAGMYLLDRTDPMVPVLTLISPCELRVPGRAFTYSADVDLPAGSYALATGNEVTVAAPDQNAVIAAPSVEESRIAYWIGRRRKSFLNREGTLILGESGVALDIRVPAQPRVVSLFLKDVVMACGSTAQNQDYEGWRAFFSNP